MKIILPGITSETTIEPRIEFYPDEIGRVDLKCGISRFIVNCNKGNFSVTNEYGELFWDSESKRDLEFALHKTIETFRYLGDNSKKARVREVFAFATNILDVMTDVTLNDREMESLDRSLAHIKNLYL